MGQMGDGKSWIPSFMRTPKPQANGGTPDETSSLLPKSNGHSSDTSSDPEHGEMYHFPNPQKSTWRSIVQEFKILLKASIPVVLAYSLQNSLQTISVIIVGRGSPEDLATAAFAYMFAMCTAWLIAIGGTTALDTLGSSTFTGSQNPHDLGVLLQRSFIVLGGFYIPVVVVWFFAEPIFRALGQGEQISHDSARFLWCLAPGGLGYIYFQCMKKYLQAQGSLHYHSAPHPHSTTLTLEQASCVLEHMSSSSPRRSTQASISSSSIPSRWAS